jgi:hypothetical protein
MDGKKYYKAKGYIGTDPDTGKKKVITISKCRTKRLVCMSLTTCHRPLERLFLFER